MHPYAIGVEIGGTKLQVTLGRTDGRIEARQRGSVASESGAQGILAWLEEAVKAMLHEARATHRYPEAIGIGFGGPVESSTGKVLTSHQIAGWQGVELRSWFEARFALPTTVANDSNAAGWAEYCQGNGQGCRNFYYMNIGSGIGGALILNGALYDGQGLGAGEIGHTWAPDWTTDLIGSADKLEHLCSGWSIEKRIRRWQSIDSDTPLSRLCEGQVEKLTCPMLAKAAEQGDRVALAEIAHVADAVGLALANVLTLTHPERIALGGGVALMGEVLLEPIRESIRAHVFAPFRDTWELRPCALEEDVVTVGALLLAGEHLNTQ